MHQDVFAGQWKQIRGELKTWWGKLADDDFDKIAGQKDKLVGAVQEKYGYAHEKAQQEVDWRLQEYGNTMNGSNGNGRPATAATEGAMATAATAVAEGWESAQGAMTTAATAVAGGVESANTYLQEKTFDEMATDLAVVIRTYPVQSLLVGAGLGYILARLTTR